MNRLCGTILVAAFACLVIPAFAKNPAKPDNDASAKSPTNSVVINVEIVPAFAESGTNHTPWHVQVNLYQQKNGGGEYTAVSNKTAVAKNGQAKFTLTVQQTNAYIMTYRVTCIGQGLYKDESSTYLPAGMPGEYNISLNMQRK